MASSLEISPLQVTDSSEVVLTTDNVLNFCQLAVLACQRANAEKNKIMRESWVRLCGTYQSRGGVLASREVRAVSLRVTTLSACRSNSRGSTGLGIDRNRNVILCHPATKDTTRQPAGCDVVIDARWGGSWWCATTTSVDSRPDWPDGAGSRLEIRYRQGGMVIPFVDGELCRRGFGISRILDLGS